MLRNIATIILLTAFAAQTFQRGFMVLDYYANTEAFAKNCENKARPQMHCNGQCLLMKKIQEEEKKDQQRPERKMENKFEVVSSRSYFATTPIQDLGIPITYPDCFAARQLPGYAGSIFHPPSLAWFISFVNQLFFYSKNDSR